MQKNILLTLFVILIISSISLKADQRNYVWTYQYMIMEPGKAEIEQYTTFSSANLDEFKRTVSSELNFEAEIGMHPHFDFAVYQNFKQTAEGNLKYDGFKLRTRIKIGEKNQFFMDPLFYLEYKGKSDFSKHVIEPKLILAKDIGKFNISLNPYCEIEKEDENEWEFKLKYALGVSYKILPLMNIGLESKGDDSGNYIGPTLSHGSEKMWAAIGSLHKIGNIDTGKPEFQVRFIIGIHI